VDLAAMASFIEGLEVSVNIDYTRDRYYNWKEKEKKGKQ